MLGKSPRTRRNIQARRVVRSTDRGKQFTPERVDKNHTIFSFLPLVITLHFVAVTYILTALRTNRRQGEKAEGRRLPRTARCRSRFHEQDRVANCNKCAGTVTARVACKVRRRQRLRFGRHVNSMAKISLSRSTFMGLRLTSGPAAYAASNSAVPHREGQRYFSSKRLQAWRTRPLPSTRWQADR
jgi:hypothetical protein